MPTTGVPAPSSPTGPSAGPQRQRVSGGLLDPKQLLTSFPDAVRKLDPRAMFHHPVLFVVEVGAVLTTLSAIKTPSVFAWVITAWLWLTSVFANLAEAVAEGRGKAQAETLRRTKTATMARRLAGWESDAADVAEEEVPGADLRLGDHVVVEAGQIIPGDGDVVEGVASVDESAITGESAPVIRESGGDRSAVTGGTKVLSDRIVVKNTSKPGETFIDRMIALVEGAARQKTPNEIALNILPASLTVIFLVAVVTLQPFAVFAGAGQTLVILVALVVGPDPGHDRRVALGDRHRRHGPARPAQRARHVGPRGGGRGRRQHPAARQNRHHHPRQSPSRRIPGGGRGDHRRTRGRRSAVVDRRRDTRGPLDRRPRQTAVRAARAQ